MFKKRFNATGIDVLPQVDILISYQNFDVALIPAAIAAGAKGIVIAGTSRAFAFSSSFPRS
jgi:L-asparaginase